MMKVDFTLRAVQLDLARQMEKVEYICQFIDFIAEKGFNALFLYLEWRVRTKTFDIGAEAGYDADEIGKIVEYAAQKGVEVIPGIASLGHHDLLFADEKYHKLCELRGNVTGRNGGSPKVEICPSLPEAREFLTDYIREVAAMFPSHYFHIGGDEAFNIGYCELCAPKARDFAGETEIVRDFFLYLHGVVAKELGKRMMMWDDMFELYPDAFRALPRDIVLVNWIYSQNVTKWWGHFDNLAFVDHFSLYEELGFDYVIAPAEYMWSNTETFTNALPKNAKHVLGGLLTMWEKRHVLLYRFYPEIAAAGALWSKSGDPAQIKFRALAELFGTQDTGFIRLVEQYMDMPNRDARIRQGMLTCHNFFGPAHARRFALPAMAAALEKYLPQYKGSLPEKILADILGNLRILEVYERAVIAAWQTLNRQEGDAMETLAAENVAAWQNSIDFARQVRGDSGALRLVDECGKEVDALTQFDKNLREKGRLTLTLCLPDGYSAETTTIRFFADGKWSDAVSGVYKYMDFALYTVDVFIPRDLKPEKIEISCRGFGGQGVCYLSVATDAGDFVPDQILETSGDVWGAERMLTPDVNFAFFGHQRNLDGFHNREIARASHRAVLSLIPREQSTKVSF